MNSQALNRKDNNECYRVGAVSFFNTLPLIFGLEDHPRIILQRLVPAQLPKALNSGSVDIGLVPSIDYQKSDHPWVVLPIAAIGSVGEVLTVRIFSQRAPEQITRLACDTDSHTSVILARIIWKLRFKKDLDITPLSASGEFSDNSAILLIGDKVLDHLDDWPYEFDLGRAWTDLTNLPFVYAFWAVPHDKQIDNLADILQQAGLRGFGHIEQIAQQHGSRHGFTVERGRQYLTHNISYDFHELQQQGLSRFYQWAHQLGLVERNRPLRFYSPACCKLEQIGQNRSRA